jgi:tripartite-type tricarboxylate transporter receptor subunit TctC
VSNKLLLLAIVLALTIPGADNSNGQSYPARNITLIAAVAPGGGDDVLARLFASKLSDRLGKSVVVENRAGAGGVIGVSSVARAAPDGYTLLLLGNSHVANQHLREPPPYDVLRDFAPISMLNTSPLLLLSQPSFPARTLPELVAMSKANPDRLTYGSPGNGTTFHLAIEMFNRDAGIKLQHVAYRGAGPAITDLLAGQIPLVIGAYAPAKSQIEGGLLRSLGTSSSKRSPMLPDSPTFVEAGFVNCDFDSNSGIVAPAGTPNEIVVRLSKEIQEIARAPEVRTKMLELGWTVIGSTPEAHGQLIKSDSEKFKKLINELGMVQR